MKKSPPETVISKEIAAAHRLYCELTGQKLGLRYDRQRAWYELLRAGFTRDDLRQLILYLQREIRRQRRNIGALKLSNLLQPDRFEEDLALSRVRLRAPGRPRQQQTIPAPDPKRIEQARRTAIKHIQNMKAQLGIKPPRQNSTDPYENNPTK